MKIEELKKFEHKLVEITFDVSSRLSIPNITYVGVIWRISNASLYNFIEINHPVNIIERDCTCGSMGIRDNDVISIKECKNPEYIQLWKDSYYEFHNEILLEKGYDSCMLDDDIIEQF